ncbi:MAG: hypothetical protein HKO71_01365 [Pseudomonadales bacterium]|nr:hypothetical protein [Pseudomonadales bacterium]
MKLQLVVLGLLFSLLAACASTTPYKPANNGTYGYRDTALGDGHHRIIFTQRSTDVAAAMDYALLRAAELALLEGHEWFVVSDRQTIVDRQREPVASIGVSRQPSVERHCGLLGCTTRTRPDTGIGAGAAAHSHAQRSEVQAILEVRLGSGELPEAANSYRAADIRRQLKNRLQINS